jgi:hypothetical protein
MVACEILWSGEIGEVQEVHAWTRGPSWPQGMASIPAPSPVPDTLDWDLWLGTAEARPFTEGDEAYRAFAEKRLEGRRFGGQEFGFYLPFNWRGFYDFGSSLIGDWGVHILGPANWGLQLSPESLLSVECVHKDSLPDFTFPWELTLKYEFGPRPGMPPVTVYWYHHPEGEAYLPPGMSVEEARKIAGQGPDLRPGANRRRTPPSGDAATRPGGEAADAQPRRRTGGRSQYGSGYNCVFVGSKGYLGTNGRGEDVGLLPGSRWAEYELPRPYLSRSPGAITGNNHEAHLNDWVRACKGGVAACSNFEIAGRYTEWLLVGAAAVHFDGKLEWDGKKGEITNVPEANAWIKPTYRKGWELKL